MSEYEEVKRIKRNRCRCRRCEAVIESRNSHDMVFCDCDPGTGIYVAGGIHNIRRGGDINLIEDLTEYED